MKSYIIYPSQKLKSFKEGKAYHSTGSQYIRLKIPKQRKENNLSYQRQKLKEPV